MTIASAPMPMPTMTRTVATPGHSVAGTGRSLVAFWPEGGAGASRAGGGLTGGVQPFASRRRMVLRDTPCSRANALTFVDLVFIADFGCGIWSHKYFDSGRYT
jgi:hypothetical protein